jgi:hypothetical protein
MINNVFNRQFLSRVNTDGGQTEIIYLIWSRQHFCLVAGE